MEPEKIEMLNNAFKMYTELSEKIKDVYEKSEEYLLPEKPELNDILFESESYMGEVFKRVANANGEVTEAEQAFIDKLNIYKSEATEIEADSLIGSTFATVPKYISLAAEVDKRSGETNYAKELVKDTLGILKELMDIDGNTYADESSFTYSFVDMLEKFIKGK